MGYWPVNEYLKQHLHNKRNYHLKGGEAAQAHEAAQAGKGKGKGRTRYQIDYDDYYNFGSDQDAEDGEGS